MIPASNAGFFTCGHSPLFFAVRVQRVNAVSQLRSSLLTFSFYYTFLLLEYLIVPPIYLHPADALYTPQFGELKYKYRNREFWCKGYYVDTVGKNESRIAEYIKHQLDEDKLGEQLSIPEVEKYNKKKK